MPTSTPGQGFPIPQETDNPDIPPMISALAVAIENRVMGVYNNVSDRSTRMPSPNEGQVAYTKDTNTFWYYDGAAWVVMFPAVPAFTSGSSVPSNSSGNNGDVFFKV